MSQDRIEELASKIGWLLKSERAQAVAHRMTGRRITSFPTLGDACSVAASNFSQADGKLSDRMRMHLKRVYAIDESTELGKDCWDEFVVGSLEDFIASFKDLHPDYRFTAVPIPARIGSIDEVDQRVFVRVDLRSQDPDPSNPTFDGELVCQVFTQVGVRLAVRRGTLKIDCRGALVPPMMERLGGKSDGLVRIKRSSGELLITPGGKDHMNWEIETSTPPIGILNSQLEGLFRVRGLKDGDEFDVSLVVEDYDLEATDLQGNHDALQSVTGDLAADTAIVRPNGAPLGINKRQLMAHIAKHSLSLFGDQRRGSAVLCRYSFRIKLDRPKPSS